MKLEKECQAVTTIGRIADPGGRVESMAARVRPIAQDTDLDRLPVLGGRLCLDFVNTIDPWYGDDRIDYIPDYDALLDWAHRNGTVTTHERALLHKQAEAAPLENAAVYRRAIDLRADLHALLRPARGPETSRSMLTLNTELRRAARFLRLTQSGETFELDYEFDDELDAVLWPVVRCAADLLSSTRDLSRVRECDGFNCGWLFIDTSKAGRRRWCSMDICGNRAKVERHRYRAKLGRPAR
jgi:predicted RNA-binding Zn ribbon-like protein